MIVSIDTVIYTAYFLIPGFIIDEVVSRFKAERGYKEFEKLLKCLGYSILELALWYWIIRIIITNYNDSTSKYWLFLILTILVTSLITGVVIGLIKQKDIFRKILSFLHLETFHSIPTGWDYKFSETKTERWVCICLDNDTYIRGKYGSNSLASSEPDNHDIYILKKCI